MPIDNDGIYTKRTSSDILNLLIDSIRTRFGNKADVTSAGTIRKLLEAAVALPLAEVQNEMDILYQQMFFSGATGQNLENLLEPFGFERRGASRAVGSVEIDFISREGGAGPVFPSGSLEFQDTSGKRFSLIDDVDVPASIHNTTATGTASESIDGINTHIAQKFSVTGDKYVQGFTLKVAHGGTAPVFDVRIETNTNGEPSGTLAHANLELLSWSPNDGTDDDVVFLKGAYLSEGDYWLVVKHVSGDGTLDGGGTGTLDQVQIKTGGGWALSTTVENLNAEVFLGGIASIRSVNQGLNQNSQAGTLQNVSFNTSPAATDWAAKVSTFTNNLTLTGGRDKETDVAFRDRVRASFASVRSASPDGLTVALQEVTGVRGVSVVENTTALPTADETEFDNTAHTGTASTTTLDSANDKIAQRFQVTKRIYVSDFSAQLASDTDLVCTVRIETDTAGEPSGTLAHANLTLSGFDFNGTAQTGGQFANGAYLSAGTDYWLVFEWESGSGTFDGDTAGTADQVKGNTGGSWVDDATIENANLQVVGGIPPHAFRAYVSSGAVDAIAQAIWKNRPAGILSDGSVSGNAIDRGGTTRTQYFERPQDVAVVVKIVVTKKTGFTGDEDDIRDTIIDYIGGFNVNNDFIEGVTVAEELVYNEIISRVLDDDNLPALKDITTLYIGRKADFADPSFLTASEVVNLTAEQDEEFTIEDATLDIDVTIN